MKKILIVDNSIVIRNILKNSFLDNQEVIIFEADSFKEVCKLVVEHTFFIVVSNLVLLDSTNSELLKLLKKENISTIIFSSNLEADSLDIEYSNIINHVIKNVNGFKFIYKLVSAMIYCNNEEILVIDDSTTQANYIKEVLEKLLVKVSIVKNGIKALSLLEKNKNISLILSDYEMPIMDGLEFTKKIRVHKYYNQIPIIIVTNIYDIYLKKQFYKYGANDILIKPILEEELISKVTDIFLNLKHIEEIVSFNQLVNKSVISSSTDIYGKTLSVSDAFCKISGYKRDELIGKNHKKGDEVLINFAKCLKDSLHRFTDFVFRLGGEEFAVVFQAENKEKAIKFAEKIRKNIENMKIEHKYNISTPYITTSMGLICKYAKDIDYNDIYKEADDLLYQAKENGRNQIKVNN